MRNDLALSVLSIGYGRQLFVAEDPERARLRACAETVDELHLVIFTQRTHCLTAQKDGQLSLHPTNACTRLGMLIAAFLVGRRILRASGHRDWVVTTQDPFEAGLAGYLLAKLFRLPLQVQEHGDFFGSDWWRTERPLNRARYLFGVWLLRRASCIRTVSVRAKCHIAALGIDPARIATLAVATDVARFRAVAEARSYAPVPVATVVALGRLVREKNLPLLMRACAQAGLRLIITGSGPEEAVLTRYAATLSQLAVQFVPWTEDVPKLFAEADIFALTSYREGWARVVVEAMAAGLPSVVTEVGCVGEVFHDGVHGRVAPVDDEAALVAALTELASDASLRAQYGAAAARDAAARAASEPPYAAAWRETFRGCGGVVQWRKYG